ncbi:FAD-dependent monooxygenase, partial [Serratia marcescens]|uniref:FAD-dependent monooxygenase n=1 Tax=Serratia marcescens TaxID=615 RepID=UPI003ED9262C
EQSKGVCEEVFADTLGGHCLVSNKSVWRNFPWVWNEHWSFKNMVLLGDALHSAHFSIGSGTRLAIEDAIALVKALESDAHLSTALHRYQASRKPVV